MVNSPQIVASELSIDINGDTTIFPTRLKEKPQAEMGAPAVGVRT